MKIATYNIWNEKSNIGIRTEQLIQEIIKIDADIIGLQEVLPGCWEKLVIATGYPYHSFHVFQDRGDGLAFLSKYPLESNCFFYNSAKLQNSCALNVTFTAQNFNFSVTNVHLPWNSVLAGEKQIVAINNYINTQREELNFSILLGDFNCSNNSSVHRFLMREQSLLGYETIWDDIASEHAKLNGYDIPATLDFATNPRWKDEPPYPGWVVDRILINGEYGHYEISNVNLFGTDISPETGLAPSDHYGVLADINFIE